MLGVSVRTLEEWRKREKGPAFSKEGRVILYSKRDIEAWRTSRRGNSTAEFKTSYAPTVVGARR